VRYKFNLNLAKRLKSWPYRIGCFALVALIVFGTFYFRTGKSSATTDTFTTSGTWTVPANVFSADFEAWGGGGAGAGSSSNGTGGGGGAGGQYAIKSAVTTNPGDNYTVTVGTTVAGGTGAGATGNDSQVTNPSSTVFIRAKGGAGGTVGGAGGTGSTTNGIGDTINRGGSGGAGSGASATAGGGGGGAGSTGNGGDGSGTTAGTGTSTNGGNGGGGGSGNYTGVAGNNYGGGGSGASKSNASARSGGGGAQGLVTVTYTVTPPTYDQNSFEFFDNADSTTPGTAHGNNSNYTLTSTGQQFRLRQLIKPNISIPTTPATNFAIQTVDASAFARPNLAVGSDGFVRMVYYQNPNTTFVRCTNIICSSKVSTTIDNTQTSAGGPPAIAMGNDGFPRIVYELTNGNGLDYVRCLNDNCTSTSSVTTIDSNLQTGNVPDIVIGADGFARITYDDSANNWFKFVRCQNADCTTKTVNTTIDTTGSTSAQLTMASDGFARIAYRNNGIRFAQCQNDDCTSNSISAVVSGISISDFTLALGSDDKARFGYDNGTTNTVKFARCTTANCSSVNTTTIATFTIVSQGASVFMASDGFARIVYMTSDTNNSTYVQCSNDDCSSSATYPIDSSGNFATSHISFVISSQGIPFVSDNTNSGVVKLAYSLGQFDLQFASQVGFGSCSSITSGNWSDVTASSAISFYDNPTPADDTPITYQSGTDPTDTGQTINAQSYRESNFFSNDVSSFGSSSDGEWDFSLKDNGASASTPYCLRVVHNDGSVLDTYTQYPTITTFSGNVSPDTPTLISPAASATNVAFTPQFTLRTTDTENDYIRYRIYLYQSDCSTAVGSSPFNQNSSQTGWSGQDANTSTAYIGNSTLTLSTIATYTYQSRLAGSTTYCWKADAIDPGGSANFGSASSTQTFTTQPPVPTAIKGGVNIRGGTNLQ